MIILLLFLNYLIIKIVQINVKDFIFVQFVKLVNLGKWYISQYYLQKKGNDSVIVYEFWGFIDVEKEKEFCNLFCDILDSIFD